MIFAELASRIAHGLERGVYRWCLIGHALGRACLTNSGQPGAERYLSGDEVRPARRATCLRIVVSEHHSLRRQLIEVWRSARHQAAVICADVRPTDVIAHNEDDVRPLWLLRGCGRADDYRRSEQRQHSEPDLSAKRHD